jgi:hypothetical protein
MKMEELVKRKVIVHGGVHHHPVGFHPISIDVGMSIRIGIQ